MHQHLYRYTFCEVYLGTKLSNKAKQLHNCICAHEEPEPEPVMKPPFRVRAKEPTCTKPETNTYCYQNKLVN